MVSSTAIAIRGNLFLETKSFFPNFNIFTKHQHGTDMFSKFPRHVSVQKVRAPASNEQARILHYGFLYIIRQCIARTTHRNQLGSLVMRFAQFWCILCLKKKLPRWVIFLVSRMKNCEQAKTTIVRPAGKGKHFAPSELRSDSLRMLTWNKRRQIALLL